MIVKRIRVLVNDVFKQTVYTAEWAQSDQDLMTKFGEPLVEVGGTFDNGSGLIFTLDPKQVKIMTGFAAGVLQTFNGATDPQAEAKCLYWGTQVEARIATEVANLRANDDNFSGETTTTY